MSALGSGLCQPLAQLDTGIHLDLNLEREVRYGGLGFGHLARNCLLSSAELLVGHLAAAGDGWCAASGWR